MDQSAGQSQSPQPARAQSQTPGHRDLMFCHECENEWYRDEHGLSCNECGSDFTEIIEDDNDPRDHNMFDHDHDDDDNGSIPSPEEGPHSLLHQHPLHNHNPWQDNNDDPDEADISNLQWRQIGPSRFNVTMYRTVSPADFGRGGVAAPGGAIGGFASLLNSLIGTARVVQPQNPNENQDQEGQREGQREGQGEATPGAHTGSGTTPEGRRFTYTASARLHPRDTEHPGPRVEPVDELNNVLTGLMAAFGAPAGPHHRHHEHGHDPGVPFHPLMGFFANAFPGSGQMGDFVYSQEGLDRIISQLMEQNATSNAPPPASQSDIDALPRKPVTENMLGPEGRAECSICMDEVNIGEDVTELPCHHWFHHPCVSAWLKEHDTCPHCRKGITKRDEHANNSPGGNDAEAGSSAGAGATPSYSMPGAFESSIGGSAQSPYVVPESPEQNRGASTEGSGASGGVGDGTRGWFGPQS